MGVRVLGDSSDHLPQMTTYGPNGDTVTLSRSVGHRLARAGPDAAGEQRHHQAGALQGDLAAGRPEGRRRRCPTWTTTSRSRTATLSRTTSGRPMRDTVRPRAAPRAWSCRRASIAAPSERRDSFRGSPARARCRRDCSCTARTICMGSSKGSAIRRRRSPGVQLRLLRLHRFTRSARSIPAASRTSPRRPGRVHQRAFRHELGGKPFHVTAGVRRENERMCPRRVSGRLPIQLTVNPADPTLLTTTFSDTQPITTESDYAYLLPSIDMKLELTGCIAPALRCFAHADPAGDQFPDAGAQRRRIAARRRADGDGRQPGVEAIPVRQSRPRGRVVLRSRTRTCR